MGRIETHPILNVPKRREFYFTFDGQAVLAREGEVISSALLASGIRVFGHHPKDGAPQGIYCANGQCAQCMVLADGRPVKACMTEARPGMSVQPCSGKPVLPADDASPSLSEIPIVPIPVLIVGGGPAGLSAAIELAKAGVRCILVDDKQRLGGKLTLQTHNFFGSRDDCHAGMRGVEIAVVLQAELQSYGAELVQAWTSSPAVGIFSDRRVGIVKQGSYVLIEPQVLLVACGAREKTLAFPGCDLPGVFGAGAFQTLVNRDLVRPTGSLFVCGGGNVGLIAAYHALQAGIAVVGLAEALRECGGYHVHLDKLLRLGVPVYTSHTVLAAQGEGRLERVVIGRIDEAFRPIPGSEKAFAVDTLLIAVGLSPINELYTKAREYGLPVFAAGDAETIAEASAAMFSGRIQGRRILEQLGRPTFLPGEWKPLLATLRGKAGRTRKPAVRALPGKVYPVIRCLQQIPCNPCTTVCPRLAIKTTDGSMTGWPSFEGESCLGCARCVSSCPGLAIVLVDESYDQQKRLALVTVPYELGGAHLHPGARVVTVGMNGEPVGQAVVVATRNAPSQNHRGLVLLEVPFGDRLAVAGFKLGEPERPEQPKGAARPGKAAAGAVSDPDTIICRCERVTKGEIVGLIRAGYRDMNQLKAALRVGMGACGGKTCRDLILKLFREEGVDLREVTPFVERPLEIEVPLEAFAGAVDRGKCRGPEL
jgi:sarcosine oxidase subunit alpha